MRFTLLVCRSLPERIKMFNCSRYDIFVVKYHLPGIAFVQIDTVHIQLILPLSISKFGPFIPYMHGHAYTVFSWSLSIYTCSVDQLLVGGAGKTLYQLEQTTTRPFYLHRCLEPGRGGRSKELKERREKERGGKGGGRWQEGERLGGDKGGKKRMEVRRGQEKWWAWQRA